MRNRSLLTVMTFVSMFLPLSLQAGPITLGDSLYCGFSVLHPNGGSYHSERIEISLDRGGPTDPANPTGPKNYTGLSTSSYAGKSFMFEAMVVDPAGQRTLFPWVEIRIRVMDERTRQFEQLATGIAYASDLREIYFGTIGNFFSNEEVINGRPQLECSFKRY